MEENQSINRQQNGSYQHGNLPPCRTPDGHHSWENNHTTDTSYDFFCKNCAAQGLRTY